jgi:hypothetical protein
MYTQKATGFLELGNDIALEFITTTRKNARRERRRNNHHIIYRLDKG